MSMVSLLAQIRVKKFITNCEVTCLLEQVARDASLKNVLKSKSIFHVLVQPGVDTAFIFSLIVIMDKLYVHNGGGGGGGGGGG